MQCSSTLFLAFPAAISILRSISPSNISQGRMSSQLSAPRRRRSTASASSAPSPATQNSLSRRREAVTSAPKSPSTKPRRRPPRPPLAPTALSALRHKSSLIHEALVATYPVAPTSFLTHSDPFTLLVAVALSAQTTDVKVNSVTPSLFVMAPTPEKMALLGADGILPYIRSLGLAPGKSRNLAKMSALLVERHSGDVPQSMEELQALPGVGRKTASVVMMQAFGVAAFPVDTHVHRLACRWGCGDAKSVERTEEELKIWFPNEESWAKLHTRIILFGREHCPARNHDMEGCPVCCFAATKEARELNERSPKKFLAAGVHLEPYSIRIIGGGAGGRDGNKRIGSAMKEEGKISFRRKKNIAVTKGAVAVGKKTASLLVERARTAEEAMIQSEVEDCMSSAGSVWEEVKVKNEAHRATSVRKRQAPVPIDSSSKRVTRSSSSKT